MQEQNLAQNDLFAQLTKEDYAHFTDVVRLYIAESSTLFSPLMCLSITGHAQNGHGRYENIHFPNAHVTDVLNVIRNSDFSSNEYERRRVSQEIDRTKIFLEKLVEREYNSDKELLHPFNGKIYVENIETHQPLFDFLEFKRKKYNIKNPKAFLKGAVMAAFMDSDKYRELTLKRFENKSFDGSSLNIGYGKCLVGDKKKLTKLGINMEFLAEGLPPFMEEIVYEDGCIIDVPNYRFSDSPDFNSDLINVYVRGREGPGTCDDAALLWIGKKLVEEEGLDAGIDAFFGGMLIDTVDTFDKINAFPMTGGADEYFGEIINNRVKELTGDYLVSEDEITSLIYFSAKNNTPAITFSDSVRRFQQQQRPNRNSNGHQYTPIQAHLAYLNEGKVINNLIFGYTLTPSQQFYNVISKRFDLMKKRNLL